MKDRFKALRKALNLSQVEFGQKIGMTDSGISEIERGTRPVQDRHIKLVLAAYPKVSEIWLRTGEGEMFASSESDYIDELIQKLRLPDVAKDVFLAYAELPPDAQEAVCDFARRVVARIRSSADVKTALDAETTYKEEGKEKRISQSETDHQELMQAIEREIIAEERQEQSASPVTDTGTD